MPQYVPVLPVHDRHTLLLDQDMILAAVVTIMKQCFLKALVRGVVVVDIVYS
jgi:hypothetical protein